MADAGTSRRSPRSNLDAARALFAEVVEAALNELPEAEAAWNARRLLGSPAAAGLGEAVFRMEAERPAEVVERLLEHKLEGEFEFTGSTRSRDGLRSTARSIASICWPTAPSG